MTLAMSPSFQRTGVAARDFLRRWRVTAVSGGRCESEAEWRAAKPIYQHDPDTVGDAVQNANAGHPGLPMGAAAMAYILWTPFLQHNPRNPQWFDRDRFILSGKHGSMLLYGLLYLSGYDLLLEEIKHFRK
jgi:hypothetical protein